ncbi:MAG: PilZ domain-containing protein [Planctomycetes bacterium]|nr:PilZ domain-containing protein [Planctomycetota bacterium]
MRLERRAQYRTVVDESNALHVTLLDPEGSPFPALLLDVSASGAAAHFFAPDCPTLPIGDRVDLVFTAERLKTPLTVAARVVHRSEDDGCRRYGFRFIEREQLEAKLYPVLRRLFNRRGAFRVAPEPEPRINVTLEGPFGPRVEGALVDLSASGTRVGVKPVAELLFAKVRKVAISLSLPDSRGPVRMTGNIRHRRLVGAAIHYGLDFDPEQSENFAHQQKAIINYVMQRE